MKKLIAFTVSLCIMLSTCITAYAELGVTESKRKVFEEGQAVADYLAKDSYTVDDGMTLYYLLKSEASVENTDSFVADVRKNLNDNDGKLVSAYGESLTTYAAAIEILVMLGEDYTDINGIDLGAAMSSMDPTAAPYSPYEYNVIVHAAARLDEGFLTAVCDTFVENHYTEGQGMNYYGFSCDNTAFLISALCKAAGATDKYNDIIEDCLNVLDSYKVDGGYCYSPEYGTAANGDSTALALMAYSEYCLAFESGKVLELTHEVYNDLLGFKGEAPGAYTYMNDGDNAFATADALRGIGSYCALLNTLVFAMGDPVEEPEEKPVITDNEKPNEEPEIDEPAEEPEVVTSPETGGSTFALSFGIALFAATAVTLKKKQK